MKSPGKAGVSLRKHNDSTTSENDLYQEEEYDIAAVHSVVDSIAANLPASVPGGFLQRLLLLVALLVIKISQFQAIAM